MELDDLSRSYYAAQIALVNSISVFVLALWALVDPLKPTSSWIGQRIGERLFVATSTGQLSAARGAEQFVTRAVQAQAVTPDPKALVQPKALAGIASDGRQLDTLLVQPLIQNEYALSKGATPEAAHALGRNSLDTIVTTQVADAARAANATAMATEPAVEGWVRMLVPPSCGRCAVLAGKFYPWDAEFVRHPRCFPAGVVVSGPASEAASRRWYEGELVVLTTASGKNLSLTGNHPVLTRTGWVPANLLQEGDEVVSALRPEGAAALIVPNHDQVPALIEDVWRSFSVGGFHRMPTATKDFHGDGGHGEVDVVRPDRSLRHGGDTTLLEKFPEQVLAGTLVDRMRFDVKSVPVLLNGRYGPHSSGSVRAGGLGLALLRGHLAGSDDAGLAGPATWNAGGEQALAYRAPGYAVLARKPEFASSVLVGRDDFLHREHSGPRWDAPGDTFSVDTRDGYARLGRDLLQRLAGQVELDRVVKLRRVEWSGHVYSLTSSEGWHCANSLIVSNCDCLQIPSTDKKLTADLRTDPKLYFESLSVADQNKYFGAGRAEQIRQGADISQTVAVKSQAAGLSSPGSESIARPMPAALIAEGRGDRDETVRLLRQHGFVD